jgi:hypothetical protein
MGKSKVPGRWDFEVRVNTPDHQVLVSRGSYSPNYMDRSLAEYLISSLGDSIIRNLATREYLN